MFQLLRFTPLVEAMEGHFLGNMWREDKLREDNDKTVTFFYIRFVSTTITSYFRPQDIQAQAPEYCTLPFGRSPHFLICQLSDISFHPFLSWCLGPILPST